MEFYNYERPHQGLDMRSPWNVYVGLPEKAATYLK